MADSLPTAEAQSPPAAGALGRLAVVGVSFRSAPLAVREALAVPEPALKPMLERLAALPGVAGAAVLSTCNRVEAYVDCEPAAVDAVVATVCPGAGDAVYRRAGIEAARHAFRVAAGLDAMALGDAQVLGQLKNAFKAAEAAGTLSPGLARLR